MHHLLKRICSIWARALAIIQPLVFAWAVCLGEFEPVAAALSGGLFFVGANIPRWRHDENVADMLAAWADSVVRGWGAVLMGVDPRKLYMLACISSWPVLGSIAVILAAANTIAEEQDPAVTAAIITALPASRWVLCGVCSATAQQPATLHPLHPLHLAHNRLQPAE